MLQSTWLRKWLRQSFCVILCHCVTFCHLLSFYFIVIVILCKSFAFCFILRHDVTTIKIILCHVVSFSVILCHSLFFCLIYSLQHSEAWCDNQHDWRDDCYSCSITRRKQVFITQFFYNPPTLWSCRRPGLNFFIKVFIKGPCLSPVFWASVHENQEFSVFFEKSSISTSNSRSLKSPGLIIDTIE